MYKILLPRRSLLKQAQAAHFNTVGYVTDIEGDLQYWKRYQQISQVLHTDANQELSLKNNCSLIYGGDVCDRGSGSMRLMKDLVSLKEKNPLRVSIILGNRDLHKLRILPAMHSNILKTSPQPYWQRQSITEHHHFSDAEHRLKWILEKTMGAPHAYQYRAHELTELGDHAGAQAPWKSYLTEMCPKTGLMTKFLEFGEFVVRVGDVLFLHGAVLEYNMGWVPPTYAEVCAHKRTASANDPLHPVSPLLTAGRYVDTVDEWIAGLNAFIQAEMADYRERMGHFLESLQDHPPHAAAAQLWESVGGYDHPQPGSRLLQYGRSIPDGAQNPSAVYASYLRQRMVPASVPGGQSKVETAKVPMSKKTAHWLQSSGVRAVVVGHQPIGDVPLYMEQHGIQILMMDTAYSDSVQWPRSQLSGHDQTKSGHYWCSWAELKAAHSAKHNAVHAKTASSMSTRSSLAAFEVLVQPSRSGGQEQSIIATGFSSAPFPFTCQYKGAPVPDPYLGRTTAAGWMVRASGVSKSAEHTTINTSSHLSSSSGDFYLLTSVEGYTFRNRLVHRDDIAAEFARSPDL